jgi:hypothetical protein
MFRRFCYALLGQRHGPTKDYLYDASMALQSAGDQTVVGAFENLMRRDFSQG